MIEAAPRVMFMDSKRSNGKPVNVAGCRERSRSSMRRVKRPTRDNEDTSSVTTEATSLESKRVDDLDVRSMEPSPVSITERIRRRLKEIKCIPFLPCGGCDGRDCKEKSSGSKCDITASMPHDHLDAEPSLKIRALFPDTESKKKLPRHYSLMQLKKTVFKARSTTPTGLPESDGCRGHCRSASIFAISALENISVSPMQSSAVRRSRRQENLVKLMVEKLEEREIQETIVSSSKTDRRTQTIVHNSDPSRNARRDHRNLRNRKIKNHRSKAKSKAVHRRTATC